MNLTVKIPFIDGWGKPDLSIEIDASIETRFHLRAAVTQAVSQGANLYGANLYGANLYGANLYGANLYGANLDGAKDVAPLALAQLSIVPEAGAFEGFKQLRNGAIAHLLIPATAKRSNATGRKCRASQAKVLAMWDSDGKPIKTGESKHDGAFAYRVGRIVKPDGFSENRFQECAPGIHFFLTRIEAENY